jgi:riboflavin kinase/FMN adenylyltransferase
MNRSIVTIGTFDGVHIGHQRLLTKVSITAKRAGLRSIAITYDRHPSQVLRPEQGLRILTPLADKIDMIKSCGIDQVEILQFTEEFSTIKAETFLNDFVVKPHQPQTIVVGYDSHFGNKRQGTFAFLRKRRKYGNYNTLYVNAINHDKKPISSTMIRNMLSDGNLDTANLLLNRAYKIRGQVVPGKGLGRELGFPTANIVPLDQLQLVPRAGIYLCKVQLQGSTYFGLTNIGKSPTLKPSLSDEIETYVIDFEGNLYGCEIEIEMIKRFRDEKKFGSKQELIDAMRHDLSLAREQICHV